MLTTRKSKPWYNSIIIELISIERKERFSSCNFDKQEINPIKKYNFHAVRLMNSLVVRI